MPSHHLSCLSILFLQSVAMDDLSVLQPRPVLFLQYLIVSLPSAATGFAPASFPPLSCLLSVNLSPVLFLSQANMLLC